MRNGEYNKEDGVDPGRVTVVCRIVGGHVDGSKGIREGDTCEVPVREKPSELLIVHVCEGGGGKLDRLGARRKEGDSPQV